MRPSRRIERIARHDAESEPRIEARGLRILLIDIDTPHAAAGDGMFHETPPQPPAPQVGRDEKHLEHPVRYAREGGETAAGTADDPEPHRRQRPAPASGRNRSRPERESRAWRAPTSPKGRSAHPGRRQRDSAKIRRRTSVQECLVVWGKDTQNRGFRNRSVRRTDSGQRSDRAEKHPMAQPPPIPGRSPFAPQRRGPCHAPAAVNGRQKEFQRQRARKRPEPQRQKCRRPQHEVRRNELKTATAQEPCAVSPAAGFPARPGLRVEAAARNRMDERSRGQKRPRSHKPAIHTYRTLR